MATKNCSPFIMLLNANVTLSNRVLKVVKNTIANLRSELEDFGAAEGIMPLAIEQIEQSAQNFRRRRKEVIRREFYNIFGMKSSIEASALRSRLREGHQFDAFTFSAGDHPLGELLHVSIGSRDEGVGISDSPLTRGITGFLWTKPQEYLFDVSVSIRLKDSDARKFFKKALSKAMTNNVIIGNKKSSATQLINSQKRANRLPEAVRYAQFLSRAAFRADQLLKTIEDGHGAIKLSYKMSGNGRAYGENANEHSDLERKAAANVQNHASNRVRSWLDGRASSYQLEVDYSESGF